MKTTPLSIAIAGTTERTVLCANSILRDQDFIIPWVLTPAPKKIGRKQELQNNPLHNWAEKQHLPTLLVNTKIHEQLKQEITAKPKPDFLLVVDFGYLVPPWLLNWPTKAPLNIHPSDLPRWRGSSPGQFALLFGDSTSAICLMEMSAGIDEGPLFYKKEFAVNTAWTQTEYYAHSFELLAPHLPMLLKEISSGQRQSTPQSEPDSTPLARRLQKSDGFIEWTTLSAAGAGIETELTNPLLKQARSHHQSLASLIVAATRAFTPWPLVWTELPTKAGPKRMQLLSAKENNGALILESVKVEGKTTMNWSAVKKQVATL